MFVPVAQRIRRETTNLEIAGSNPVGNDFFLSFSSFVCLCAFSFFFISVSFNFSFRLFVFLCGLGLVGYDVCFTRRRSWVRFPELVHIFCLFYLFFFLFSTCKSANSSVVRIPRCQRGGPGSIPGWRTFDYSALFFSFLFSFFCF